VISDSGCVDPVAKFKFRIESDAGNFGFRLLVYKNFQNESGNINANQFSCCERGLPDTPLPDASASRRDTCVPLKIASQRIGRALAGAYLIKIHNHLTGDHALLFRSSNLLTPAGSLIRPETKIVVISSSRHDVGDGSGCAASPFSLMGRACVACWRRR